VVPQAPNVAANLTLSRIITRSAIAVYFQERITTICCTLRLERFLMGFSVDGAKVRISLYMGKVTNVLNNLLDSVKLLRYSCIR
jgi:hypothetical protein